MKKILSLALLLAVCLFAAPASAEVGQATLTGTTISGINPSDSDALIIPVNTTGFSQNFFTTYSQLKYILLDHDSTDPIAFNLKDAANLEAVYLNFGPPQGIYSTLQITASVPVLQYVSLSEKTVTVSQNNITAQDGVVQFSFNDIIPDDYPGYHYVVTRTQEGSDNQPDFSSASDYANFSISNGTVTFTDVSVSLGKTYEYSITVFDPFGNAKTFDPVSVSVPHAPGLLLLDSSWSNYSLEESFPRAEWDDGDTSGTEYRLKLSPINDDDLYDNIKKTPISDGLLSFTPTNALAIDLTPQYKNNNNNTSQWLDYNGNISLSAEFPLNKLIPEGTTIRNFAVLHLDQTKNVWDRSPECVLLDRSAGEEDPYVDPPLTVSGDHFIGMHLSHFSPFVILWEEIDPVVLSAIDSLPDTGDRAPLAPWLFLLGASALLLAKKKNAAST